MLCMLLTFSSSKDLFFSIWIGESKFPTFARNWNLISFCLKTYRKLSRYPVCFRAGTACFFDTHFKFILSSVFRRQVIFLRQISRLKFSNILCLWMEFSFNSKIFLCKDRKFNTGFRITKFKKSVFVLVLKLKAREYHCEYWLLNVVVL